MLKKKFLFFSSFYRKGSDQVVITNADSTRLDVPNNKHSTLKKNYFHVMVE